MKHSDKEWSLVLLCTGDKPWSQVTLAVVGLMGIPVPSLGVSVLLGEATTLAQCSPGWEPSSWWGLRLRAPGTRRGVNQHSTRASGLPHRHAVPGAVFNL